MDILSLGASFGTSRFYAKLVTLIERLKAPDAFLAEEDLEAMARLAPLRHVRVVTTQLSSLVCKDQMDELPRAFSQVVRFDADRQVVCAAGPVLLIILVRDVHYSAVVVDCVDRLAYAFDSSPSLSHRESAKCLLKNLHRCGVIDTPDLVACHEFHQTSTQCGVFVLALAAHLDTWLDGEPDLMRPRSDFIREAMEKASDCALIGKFRAEMHDRVSNAAVCLFNARPLGHDVHSRPQPPEPESSQQSELLGPFASRAALYTLCTTGQAPTRLFIESLSSIMPASISIGLHEIVGGSTTMTADAVRLLHEHQFSLVVVTSAPPGAVVLCATLMVRDVSADKSYLFMPSGDDSVGNDVLTTLDAVRAATGALSFSVPDNTMRGAAPAALPLTIFMWWAHTNRVVPDDEVGAQLVAACQSAVLPVPLRTTLPLCDDWIFRRVLCTAMDSGHRAILSATQAMESNPLARVLIGLNRPVMSARAAARAVRQNSQEIRALLQRLDELAADTIEYAALHAPPRWRVGMDAPGFAAMYARIVDQPSTWILEGKITEMFRAARRASAIGLDTGSVWRTILTVVNLVSAGWPCMVVALGVNSASGHLVAKAVALDCEQLIPALRQSLGAPLDEQPPLLICPVAVLAEGTLELRAVVSACTMRDMQRRSELVLGVACDPSAVSALPAISLSLTGSVQSTAPSTHAMASIETMSKKNVPQFIQPTRSRIAMPVVIAKADVKQTAVGPGGDGGAVSMVHLFSSSESTIGGAF